MKNIIIHIVRWAFCETPPINAKKHSLVKWLAFHKQIT